jgi:intron-binding protein aquarius
MYLRLMGVAARRISIITSYNGQKSLLHDIAAARCASNALFGMPHKIDTVDKFQGQQNDFVLLSLVRTKSAGHIRDVRRLVVAMSRARLGLYVFGRADVFKNSYELVRTFSLLLARPTALQLYPTEQTPHGVTERRLTQRVAPKSVCTVANLAAMGTLVHQMTQFAQSQQESYERTLREFNAAQAAERKQHQERVARVAAQQEQVAKQDALIEAAEKDDAVAASAAADDNDDNDGPSAMDTSSSSSSSTTTSTNSIHKHM